MKTKMLIKYLKRFPDAKVMFNEDVHFPNQFVDVSLLDFTYKSKENMIVLPNLCNCYPEPD